MRNNGRRSGESWRGGGGMSVPSSFGIYVYAAGAILLGLVGLAWGDFAVPWQHVGPHVPLRAPAAYLTASVELAAGLSLLWRRTARAGALTLTVVSSAFMLLWLPKALSDSLRDYDARGNVFEQLSLVVAGAVLFASLSPAGSSIARRESLFARLYGLSAISFGIAHVYFMPITWTPGWIPPSPVFWDYLTTIAFFAAAAAILSGIMAPLASRLITAEIVGFQILVWTPRLFAAPHDHFNWAGNAISIAISGATWVVSDSICRSARQERIQSGDNARSPDSSIAPREKVEAPATRQALQCKLHQEP